MPYSARRDGLLYSYPRLTEDVSADVAVVGAGITGALVAWELTAAGANVVVVDRGDVAMGSSAASTGLLMYDTDASFDELTERVGDGGAARVYRLGLEAIDYLERVTASLAGGCAFARRPSLYLASRRLHRGRLRREADHRIRHGFEVEWLDRAPLRERFGLSAPGALRVEGTAQVDCYQLTHQLLADAERLGARVFDRTNVSLSAEDAVAVDGTLTLSTESGKRVRASRVVWATGYEAHRFLDASLASLTSTWCMVTEPIAEDLWPEQCLMWETARPYLYLRATDDRRILAGGEDEPCAECHRSAYWYRTKSQRLLKRVRSLFPHLELEIDYAWAGTFGTSHDGMPFIGESDRHPGLWLALGYGGNGITFSAIAAWLIRDAWLGRTNADADLFRLGR